MKKRLSTGYTFTAASKTITHADFSDIGLAGIQLITNVTDQIIIYNFADTTKGGTLATDTLTLEYDTTSMSDTDELMILVEDGINTIAVTQSGTWDEVGINDSGNSITVDNSTLSVVGGGTEATAMRVTIASDSTGVLSVDDNGSTLSIDDGGGAITVDGTVAVTGVATEATLSSLLTSSQLIDDTVQVLGTDTYTEATSKGITIGAVRRDADTTLVNTTNEFGPLQMDANGRLKVEAFSGETLPVSLTSTTITGTVAVTQSGTWDEVGINDSGNSITVDDGGSSLTIDGSVSITGSVDTELPTAAALADNTVNPTTTSVGVFPHWYDGATWDRALGNSTDGLLVNLGANNDVTVTGTLTSAGNVTNAGTFVVQENGSALTALQKIDNIAHSGSDVALVEHVPISGQFDDTATTTVTENNLAPVRITSARALHVQAQANSGVDIGDVTINNASGGSAVNIQDGGNSITVDGTVTVTGVSTLAEQQTQTTALQLIDDIVYTDDTSTHSTGTSKGALMMAAATPTDTAVNANDIGALGMTNNRELYVSLRDISGTAAVTGSGTATGALRVELANNGTGLVGLNTGTNSIGTVQPGNTANTTPWLVTDTPSTTGGLSKFHLVGAATTNATNVKASAGQVYSITAFNVSASPRYLKFHNTAGTPTAGSGVTDTYLIPGNTSGAGVVFNIDKGIAFSTGIGITLVTDIADAGTTAIGASEVVVNIYYK